MRPRWLQCDPDGCTDHYHAPGEDLLSNKLAQYQSASGEVRKLTERLAKRRALSRLQW
jgi:hypothetical protein